MMVPAPETTRRTVDSKCLPIRVMRAIGRLKPCRPFSASTSDAMAVLLAAVSTLSLLACGTVHNYLDPEKPRYIGTYGTQPAGGGPVRVVTFNIQNAVHIFEAIKAFRSHAELKGPDVLLLQEMDGPGVELIARALALNYVYFPASVHPMSGRDFGNAILSPWPMDRPRKLFLPHGDWPNGQRRAAVSARVAIDGVPVLVYSVHLGAPVRARSRERRDQIETILADAQRSAGPVIIGGDFNSYGLGPLLQSKGFSWVTQCVGRSAAFWSFDHVFVNGLAPAFPHAAGVARDVRGVSDHRPVWAVLAPVSASPKAAPGAAEDGPDGRPPKELSARDGRDELSK